VSLYPKPTPNETPINASVDELYPARMGITKSDILMLYYHPDQVVSYKSDRPADAQIRGKQHL